MRWIRTHGIKGTPRREDYDYAELLLDELRREDELFSSRLNLFLVAESLLFVSYATFIGVPDVNSLIIGEMGILGILITFIYAVVINRSVVYIGEIKTKLKSIYPNYNKLKEKRTGKGGVNKFLRLLPEIFLVAWILMIIISLFI